MSEEGQQPDGRGAGRWWRLIRVPRRGRIPFGIAVALLIALVILWDQRRPIAANFIDSELAKRGIPARYRVAQIGTSSQRLEDVVIGDPANPDLVADWVVVNTDIGLSGARVTGIEAGQVRLRGRIVGGRLALGYLDRFLPAPSGAPFSLPDLMVSVADARMRLETPQGLVGVKLSGSGRLNDGFSGRVAAVSDRLRVADCAIVGVTAAVAVAIDKGAPSLRGPVGARGVDCGATGRAQGVGVDLIADLGAQLDTWRGRGGVAVARVAGSGVDVGQTRGTIAFAGTAAGTQGDIDLTAQRFVSQPARGRDVSVAGRYRIESGGARFAGRVAAGQAGTDAAAGVATLARRAAGTPFAELAAQLGRAITAAGRRGAIDAAVAAQVRGSAGAVVVRDLTFDAASGARLRIGGGQGIRYGWPGARLGIDGVLAMRGGGLPQGEVRIMQRQPGDPITGQAVLLPYRAGSSSLALAPVSFRADPDGATRIATSVTLSGPLPGGRIEGLRLPIDARWNGPTRLTVNAGCVPAGFDRLVVSSLALGRAALTLCPTSGALVALDGANVTGGATAANPRFAGRIGSTPLALTAMRASFALADMRLAVDGLTARLGDADRLSTLDVAALGGRIVDGAVAGTFAGASGAIGNVPILLSEGAGAWRFADSRLTLDGSGLRVADAAAEPRYNMLAADDFALTLAGNRIDATGTLTNPATAIKVAGVVIRHDLGAGSGQADLAVPGITFGEALQPDALTRLTFGVIADVEGTVSGDGAIRWSPDGVTSDGVFRTAGTNLAAAFGPVEGISGEIRFTDLLGLRSADRQLATIALANPGIPVENGEVRYRLIGDQRVAVEGGRWPFAGGALVLEPTTLDFGADVARHMVFRVVGIDGAQFLQQFDFDNLDATGIFDGELPMVFDQQGGRIENGRLTVREGGGTIAYVGEISQEDVGVWGNLAFQALKSIKYDRLNLVLNGPLSGEMVTAIQFAGISQGKGTKSNFIIDRLARLPLVFNITIRAPFRQLLDSVQSYYDPTRLIERNLPALLEEQQRRTPTPPPAGVQPPASEIVP